MDPEYPCTISPACAGIFFGLALLMVAAATRADVDLSVLYLKEDIARPPVLSNLSPPAADSGLAGAILGISDSNTTGRFLKQRYALDTHVDASPEALIRVAREHVDKGNGVIVADLSKATLLRLLQTPELMGKTIVINSGAPDDELRRTECTSGLLHTLPSRAMLSDALAQFLIARRWKKWLLVHGDRPADLAWVSAIQRSEKRYGGRIVATKQWTFDTDLRRTAQQEMPLFTQGRDYDVTLIADDIGDVGEYVPYNTWLPRPVAGTQGLTPTGWHPVVEQWGAQQLQNRFTESAGRGMDDRDYAAWLAIRAVAEAVTRSNSSDARTLYTYMLSDAFEVAAFKGRSLTFRRWNGQLRQPIPLVQPRALVSQSPQPGFLHPRTELDTLGYDAPESTCEFKDAL